MLRQALKDFSARRGLSAGALLEAASITPTARAEEVEIEGFVALARAATREI
jgi:16S rRNA (adenine1518-N6/adenine1519-N6)-dimethyltransferase